MPKVKKQKPDTNTHPGIISEPYIATLDLTLLKVPRFNETTHRGYQRELSTPWVEHLKAIWSEQLCGLLEVVHRPDGTYGVPDGGHRLEVRSQLGYKTAICRVRDTDGSVEAEAWLFEHFNKQRKGVSPFNLMMAALKHNDPLAVAILNTVKAAGYRVTSKHIGKDDKSIGVVNAVSKMYALARKNLTLFERIFPVAAKLHNGSRIDNRTLNGLFSLERYLQTIYPKRHHKQESILDPANLKKLIKMGHENFFAKIHKWEGTMSGNNVAHAQINSLIDFLNVGRADDDLIPYDPRGGE